MYTPTDYSASEHSDDEEYRPLLVGFPNRAGSPSTSPRLPGRRLDIGETLYQNMTQTDEEAYDIALAVANRCSQFCQAYSTFMLLKERYKKNAKNPIIEPDIDPADDEDNDDFDEDLEIKAEYIAFIIFHEIRTTIKDCRTISQAWEKKEYNDSTLEAALASTLMLCQPKITKAAKSFGSYYQLLSSKTQNALEINNSMNIGFILSLAGYKTAQPIVEDEPPPDSRAAKLLALGIDDSDIPEHFICPVSGQIMEQPVCMGNGDVWHTYDASTVIRIANDEKEDARCPETRALFSTLKFKVNAALDEEIENWFSSKARPETPRF
jgi:hypothetical protein